MNSLAPKTRSAPAFSEKDHDTWRRLYAAQRDNVFERIHPMFGDGLEALQISSERVPDLGEVNSRLHSLTGFEGVFVDGLEDPLSFFPMLAARRFPIGAFIRSADDLSYTPAPDVFHDLYGHLPFLADPAYADFSQKFGERASRYLEHPKKLKQWDRFYWFTMEFGLIRTPRGTRIFGGGIASSSGETKYALSGAPVLHDFNLDKIRKHDFKIDEFQKELYVLSSTEQLYKSLDAFEKGLSCDQCGNGGCAKNG